MRTCPRVCAVWMYALYTRGATAAARTNTNTNTKRGGRRAAPNDSCCRRTSLGNGSSSSLTCCLSVRMTNTFKLGATGAVVRAPPAIANCHGIRPHKPPCLITGTPTGGWKTRQPVPLWWFSLRSRGGVPIISRPRLNHRLTDPRIPGYPPGTAPGVRNNSSLVFS